MSDGTSRKAAGPGTWRVHPFQRSEIGSGRSKTNAVTGGEVDLSRVAEGRREGKRAWDKRQAEHEATIKRDAKRKRRHRNRGKEPLV